MTNSVIESGSSGVSQTKSRNRRYWGLWVVALVGIFATPAALHYVLGYSVKLNGKPNPNYLLGCVIAWELICASSTILYHLIIDEQEEYSYLWGGTIAWYFIAFVGIGWWALSLAGLLPPVDFPKLLIGSCVTYCIVWLWRQYR